MKFSTSVNIERDKDKAFNYIITANAKQTIGKIVDSFTAGIHSFCLIGSYGTGKSSFSPDLEMIDLQFDTLFFFQKRVRFIPNFLYFCKKRFGSVEMTLPYNYKLSISSLSGIFSKTTATYKFYWFVALLDIVVKERKNRISFWEIIAGMLAESWYPIHYFKLSFGKSDSLYVQSLALQKELNIPIDTDKGKIKQTLLENLNNNLVKSLLRVFSLNVPYRFLSPWIRYTTDNEVVLSSQKFENECLYAITDESIEINPKWIEYLSEHCLILRDFAFWNLTEFLQKRNPNVPDVPSKLIKPIQRDSLTKQHKFWDTYIEIVGSINCIYTEKQIFAKQYDLDHFVPWSFVSHNLLWNLIPADSSINSSKSNNLPQLEKYLKPFADVQHNALKTLYAKNPNNSILEDYLIVYDSVVDLVNLSEPDFYNAFRKIFSPMVQIAENMGFKYWER